MKNYTYIAQKKNEPSKLFEGTNALYDLIEALTGEIIPWQGNHYNAYSVVVPNYTIASHPTGSWVRSFDVSGWKISRI